MASGVVVYAAACWCEGGNAERNEDNMWGNTTQRLSREGRAIDMLAGLANPSGFCEFNPCDSRLRQCWGPAPWPHEH